MTAAAPGRALTRRPWLAAALVAGVAIATYLPARHHDFVDYDDPIYVLENPTLVDGVTPESALRAFSEFYEANWIPLTMISHQLDYALFGLEPAGHKLVNVGLHALASAILLLFLARATRALWPSLFVAGVFALHPLHVESVAWISERKDMLSAVFFMATLLAWTRYARSPGVFRYTVALLLLACGLLSKPMLVTLPFVLLLIDFWPLARLSGPGPSLLAPAPVRRALLEKAPMFLLAAGTSAIAWLAQREWGAMNHGDVLGLDLRVGNALLSIVAYLRQTLWPTGLAAFYPHAYEETPLLLAGLAGVALLAVTAGTFLVARSRPYVTVGWLWFLGMLAPVIGIVQVGLQARADRYMYLPLVGLSIAVAWCAVDLAGRRPAARLPLAISGAIVLFALAACTRVQLDHWRDTEALFAHAVEVTKENFLAHHHLAAELLDQDRIDEAETHYGEALRIKPGWYMAHVGVGDTLMKRNLHAEAIPHYQRAIALAPRHDRAHAQLGIAFAEVGRLDDALAHHRRALEIARPSRKAHLHALLASSYARRDQLGRAIQHFRRAIRLRPFYGEAHANLGFALIRAGRVDEARAHLDAARRLGATSAELRAGLAHVATDPAEMADHYREALRMRPDWTYAANNLAWLLAAHPSAAIRNPPEAIRLAEALAGRTHSDPGVLDTLAAAYAAGGRREDAIATATRALRLAEERQDAAFAADLSERISLYGTGRAYVDPDLPPAR